MTIIVQDYGFDYSDEEGEGNESASADVENMYYTAKGMSLHLSWSGHISLLLKGRRKITQNKP